MKIVFLVHYFPPLNSTGARRVLSLCKYLSRVGYKIDVISTKKTNKDGILSEEIPTYCNLIELPDKTIVSAKSNTQRKVYGKNKRSKLGEILIKLKRYLMNYFGQLIDHRLLYSLNFINPFLSKEVVNSLKNCDIIISSCPPWPVHLAGMIASIRFKKKWIADYRDQFSGNHIFPGNKFTRYIENKIEKKMLSYASALTVISVPMQIYYEKFHPQVNCIENGYDHEDFENNTNLNCDSNSSIHKKYIRYFGSISKYRVPKTFFNALESLSEEYRSQIIIEFYGETAAAEEEINKNFPNLKNQIFFNGLIPYHQAIKLMLKSDALLIQEASAISNASLSAQGTMTTKLYEYLGAKKPIIAEIDEETILAKTILNSGLSITCCKNTKQMMFDLISWIDETKVIEPNLIFINGFTRENLSNKYNILIKNL
jgi:glycosyltransferase involved in cell wall biosynthesis